MKRKKLSYTVEELAWIKDHRTLPRREAHAEFCHRFKRSDISADNYKALCSRKKWATGRDGCLKPGNVPPILALAKLRHARSAKSRGRQA